MKKMLVTPSAAKQITGEGWTQLQMMHRDDAGGLTARDLKAWECQPGVIQGVIPLRTCCSSYMAWIIYLQVFITGRV